MFTNTNKAIKNLLELSSELKHLMGVMALLSWDQETYLPPKGALTRAHQLELLSGIYHDHATAKKMESAIAKAEEAIASDPSVFNAYDRALVREMKRDFTLATKLPKKLVQELSKESSLGLEAWKHARTQNTFSLYQPSLETMVKLKREAAECMGYGGSPYDALLDEYEQGFTKKLVKGTFDPLKKQLEELIPILVKKTAPWDKGVLKQSFDSQKLWQFSLHLLEVIGFDSERGRQDLSAHPFTMGLSNSDVRLTTRIVENNPVTTLLSSIHEGGHGMYEQGISDELTDTNVGYANSLVIHESQSRFWENMIGRSQAFWDHIYPQFRALFPRELGNATAEDIWKELNVVRPSLIRVDADEVTYHMHIIIRFEIESALIEGTLKPKDVPEAWNAKYKEYLGIDVPSDALGCLQDIHWSQGLIGYFPTYSFGSLFSCQLFEKLTALRPDLENDVRLGKFEIPLHWLNETIHQHGRLYTSEQLAQASTGKPLSSDAFLTYIKEKFQLPHPSCLTMLD